MELSFENLPEDDIAVIIHKMIEPGKPKLGIKEASTGVLMPSVYRQFAQRVLDFEVREDDIWMIADMKCGTQWCTEMLWYLMNLDNLQEAVEAQRIHRFSFLEYGTIGYSTKELEELPSTPSPRLIKSHLPKEFLPRQLWSKNPKIIYVARNPKDAALSLYHHYKNMYGYSGPLELLLESFYKEKKMYGSYWKHVLGFWNLRHLDNVLFLTYEEMCKNLEDVIRKASAHVGVSVSEAQMEKLLHLLKLENMRVTRNRVIESCGVKEYWKEFLREGKPGSARAWMSREMEENFDNWTRECVAHSDLCVQSLLS